MSQSFGDLPGWSFNIEEVSANVYCVTATDSSGRQVQITGTNFDALLQDAKEKVRQFCIDHGPGE